MTLDTEPESQGGDGTPNGRERSGRAARSAGTTGGSGRRERRSRQGAEDGPASRDAAPWREVDAWRTPEIPADDRTSLKGTWIFAGVWTAVTAGVAALLPGALEKSPRLGWLLLLFPASAVGVLIHAVVETVRWRRHGRVVFEMDPHPGSLGGEVAGVVEHPGRFRPGDRYRVVLNCVRDRMRRQERGIHEDRLESPVRTDVTWQAEGHARAGPGPAGGTRMAVRFEVPGDLPESERTFGDERTRHRWELFVEGEGRTEGFERRFDLPVFDTGGQSSERWSEVPLSTEHGPEDEGFPEGEVVIREGGDGEVAFHYPRSRHRSLGAARVAAGVAALIFPPALVGLTPLEPEPLVPAVAGGFIALSVGLVLVGSGLWHLLNELHVSVGPERVRVVREVLGMRATDLAVAADDVMEFSPDAAGRGKGRGRERSHRIVMRVRGARRVVVGDGLDGRRLARRVCERMREAAST